MHASDASQFDGISSRRWPVPAMFNYGKVFNGTSQTIGFNSVSVPQLQLPHYCPLIFIENL